MVTPLKDGYDLFHAGVKAFSDMEWRGMKIDLRYCEATFKKMERKIAMLKARVFDDTKEGMEWRRKFGSKTNMESNTQLSEVLFGERGHGVDEAALKRVDTPFTAAILDVRKLAKAKETYIGAIMRNVDIDGILRCSFNLSHDDNTVCTYRSSSSNINFQNIPMRDPEIMNLVRTAFIPRPGFQMADFDFKGAEVGVGACYHKDPKMIEYIKDKSKDMHRDAAVDIFKLPVEAVTKEVRHAAKNRFVFPQFYGSNAENCAVSLWDFIGKDDGMKAHMRQQGIKGYDSFLRHLTGIADRFWKVRFKSYRQWRYDWFRDYKAKGWFHTYTGFICRGQLSFTQATNFPIQGSAFHCLLWTLIKLNAWMKRNKMRSGIIGQIHDSVVVEVWPPELQDIMDEVRRLLTHDLPKAWPWIIVPLEMESEIAGVDESWNKKKKVG